jgi:hypothetical protein
MGQATATNYIIASMQVPTCVARIRPVHSWKFVKWPKVAEAEADAGGQHLLGQANCGGVLVESTIRPPLYICSSGLVLD